MRPARSIAVIFIFLTFLLIVYTFLLNLSTENDIELKSTAQIQTQRYVTPSLADLGIHGILPAVNDHAVMLTSVPKAGGEILVLILQRLQGYNAFKHIRLPPGDAGTVSTLQQELLVEEITSIIRQEAVPLSFDGDVHFLNFSQFGRQSPSFISLVRDPRVFQRYRKKFPGKYGGAIPHFCGQDARCTIKNNRWSLETAQNNVRKWYRVVGVLENMKETLNRLEQEFPIFFRGANRIFRELEFIKQPTVDPGSLMVNERVSKALECEIEFYLWLKSRLLNQTSDNG